MCHTITQVEASENTKKLWYSRNHLKVSKSAQNSFQVKKRKLSSNRQQTRNLLSSLLYLS